MASIRGWRPATSVSGPEVATADDIRALNGVFSDAFSERYRRDGMVGVRVPNLNPQIWRYAIEDAAQGALLWRDARGEIVDRDVRPCMPVVFESLENFVVQAVDVKVFKEPLVVIARDSLHQIGSQVDAKYLEAARYGTGAAAVHAEHHDYGWE